MSYMPLAQKNPKSSVVDLANFSAKIWSVADSQAVTPFVLRS